MVFKMNNEADGSSAEGDPQRFDRVVARFGLGAWKSFRVRRELPVENQRAVRRRSSLLVPFPRRMSEPHEDSDTEHSSKEVGGGVIESADENVRPDAASVFELIDDNGNVRVDEWNEREHEGGTEVLSGKGNDDPACAWSKEDEASVEAAQQLFEMIPTNKSDAFLALRDPKTDQNEIGQQVTKTAIGSLFFAEPTEPQSVLLKRGPVLLNGEERELMVFANGFLFANVEMDALVSLLVDNNSEELKNPASERLIERFRDIDTHHSGSLDREDINDFFRGMGVPLSTPAIDRIMNRYDSDTDGNISWSDFEAMTQEVKRHKQTGLKSHLPWRQLGTKLRGALHKNSVDRRLDVAFQMTDIEKIENLGICHSDKTRIFADSGWAHLTLALHIKGADLPLLVTCAKPGHVKAWMEAFRACIAGMTTSASGQTKSTASPDAPQEVSGPGMIWGVRKPQNEKVRVNRSSLNKWYVEQGSNVDWGGED